MALRTQHSENPGTLWSAVIKLGAVAAFTILVACLIIPLRRPLADYRELTETGHVLDADRAALQRDIARREAELVMLERDPHFIEIKARDTLDMCQPGEVVFRFEGNGSD